MPLPRTPSFRLDGRRALVTGASSGIGLASAAALAEAGAAVTMVARGAEPLEAARARIAGAEAEALDIADIAALRAMIAARGPFDVLVNAAGTALSTLDADFDAVAAVNVKAAYFAAQAVAQGLVAAGRPGSIIQISSQMGHVGGPERAVYCATKHAVEGMTKAMALEWGGHGIRVNTLCPTFILTPLTLPTFDNPDRRAWIDRRIALVRVGELQGIMGALVYLASDASALVTGAAMCVDGGMTVQGRVTAQDVAKLAGVSQPAVSRVFTPGASVAPATAARVRAAAESLGYRPNSLARAMITGRSRMIGVVVAYLDNQFYPVALERLSHALQARGYHVLLFMAANAPGEMERLMEDLLAYQVDGIVTASVAISNDVTRRCAAAGIPLVMFNRGQPDSGLSSVTSANALGGRKVARFLVAGGHRRIAHVSGWQGASTGRDRARGLVEGLAEAGMAPHAMVDGMYDRDTAAAAGQALMEAAEPPDAIFVGNDHMAFAVMDRLRAMELRVPGDVSLVGYDDVPMAAWGAYDLTTVRQRLMRMVEATVETLLAQIDDPARATQNLEIDAPLILRGSARRPEGGHDAGV